MLTHKPLTATKHAALLCYSRPIVQRTAAYEQSR